MEFNNDELEFISNCLISYQSVLIDMNKKSFGSVNEAMNEQIQKIAEINNKLVEIRKD